MRTQLIALFALTAVVLGAGCDGETEILVTVDVGPDVSATVDSIRFTTNLSICDRDPATNEFVDCVVQTTDEHIHPESGKGPVTLPSSFLVVAHRRGEEGEVVQVFAEALGASGEVIGRSRGIAPVVKNQQTSMQLRLEPPCGQVEDCLGGANFCDSPHVCNCEGDSCLSGFCERIAVDDDNACTVDSCFDDEFQITHEALESEDGEAISCGADDAGVALFCAQGLCKSPKCGDFIVDNGEECDDGDQGGNSNIRPLACREDCRVPSCGDGVVDTGIAFGKIFGEGCDQGTGNSNTSAGACRQQVAYVDETGAAATAECQPAFCGDGVQDGNERCDDNNRLNGDGCNPTCSLLGEVTIYAGQPGGSGYADGLGTDARLGNVLDVALGGGFAYFTDRNTTIRRAALADGAVTTLAGVQGEGGTADSSPGVDALLLTPTGLLLTGQSLVFTDRNSHTLRVVDLATGDVSTLAGIAGEHLHRDGDVNNANAALRPRLALPTLLAQRSADEIIFTDDSEAFGCRLRQLNTNTGIVSTLAGDSICFAFDPAAYLGHVTGLAVGPGDVAYIADGFSIREIDLATGLATTVAGSINPPVDGYVDGLGATARFGNLGRIASDGTTLFIADRGNEVVRTMDIATYAVGTLDSDLAPPMAVSVDGTSLVVGEQNGSSLKVGDLSGVLPLAFSVLAGLPSGAGDNAWPGAGSSLALTDALFDRPFGLAVGSGHLYVADGQNAKVKVIDLTTPEVRFAENRLFDGQFVTSVTTNNGRIYAILNESLVEVDPTSGDPVAELSLPNSFFGVVGGGDVLYASSGLSTRSVWRIDSLADLTAAIVSLFAGDSLAPASAQDGPLSTALFASPTGLTLCAGDLYVTDASPASEEYNVVRKVALGLEDTDPNKVTTIAGFPTVGAHRDGYGTQAYFDQPLGLTCDDRDLNEDGIADHPTLYVTDAGSHTVRQIDLTSGYVSTVAGTPYVGASLDGTGTAGVSGANAGFNRPMGIAFDPVSGDLFVTDENENVIRRIH